MADSVSCQKKKNYYLSVIIYNTRAFLLLCKTAYTYFSKNKFYNCFTNYSEHAPLFKYPITDIPL